jgi:hypothetical protein
MKTGNIFFKLLIIDNYDRIQIPTSMEYRFQIQKKYFRIYNTVNYNWGNKDALTGLYTAVKSKKQNVYIMYKLFILFFKLGKVKLFIYRCKTLL